MKKYIFSFLFTTVLLSTQSCNSQDTKSSKQVLNDSSKKMLEINIAANSILRGLTYLDVVNVYDDTLFLITNDSRLLQVNLKNGTVTNFNLSSFIDKQKKAGYPLTFFAVNEDCYYLCFRNILYQVQRTGQMQKIFSNGIIISWIEKLKDGFLVADQDSVKLISNTGKKLAAKPFVEFNNNFGFVKEKNAICYQGLPTDSIVEFTSSLGTVIDVSRYASLSSNAELKEPFVSYATDKYFIVFDYWKRNALYVLTKGEKKNELVKTISLKDLNYMPSQSEIQKEEGQPNFKIAFDRGTYYVIALGKGKLKIKPFTL